MSGHGMNNPMDAIIGQNIGAAINRSRQNAQDNNAVHQANSVIGEANRRLDYAEPLAQDYQAWLSKKKEHVDQFSFEIWAEMRPDKRNPAKMELDTKRVFNIHLIAWTEWWAESVRGSDLLAKEKAPKLRGLSDALMRSEIQASAAAKALADIADRLELTKGLENPREWVDKRVNRMWQNVKWKQNDPTIPIYSSLSPFPPVSQHRVDESGGKFDPMEHNLYGINEMMIK